MSFWRHIGRAVVLPSMSRSGVFFFLLVIANNPF
jgi:hypothetical protein